MYATYCSVCHGADGRGNGPAAAALKVKPTDLTQLTRTNGGRYPDAHVYAVLQFGVETPAHGTPQMPVWGTAFRSLERGSTIASLEEHQRLTNLTNYLRSMQQ